MSQNLTPASHDSSLDPGTAGAPAARAARAKAEAARAAARANERAARRARAAEPVRVTGKHHVLVRISHWAHVPLLLHPNPKRAAIIGLGSGVTLGSALTHPLTEATVLGTPNLLAAAETAASAGSDHCRRSQPRHPLYPFHRTGTSVRQGA